MIFLLAGRHINDLQRQFNVRIQISKQVCTNYNLMDILKRYFKYFFVNRPMMMEQRMPKYLVPTTTIFKTLSRQSMKKSRPHLNVAAVAVETSEVDVEVVVDMKDVTVKVCVHDKI